MNVYNNQEVLLPFTNGISFKLKHNGTEYFVALLTEFYIVKFFDEINAKIKMENRAYNL